MGKLKLSVLLVSVLSGLLRITTAFVLIENAHSPSRLFSWSLMPRTTYELPPKADGDGLCYRYTVEATDTCKSIAQAYEITVADIGSWNSQTYGWKGCDNMHQGDFICLSTGSPPMPVALPAATCGPQVPGTARPSNYADLSSLNPCSSDKCVSLSISVLSCDVD